MNADYMSWDINDCISVNLDKANKAFLDNGYRAACGMHLKSYFEKRLDGERVIIDDVDITMHSDSLAVNLVQSLGNVCDDMYYSIREYSERSCD